MAGATKITTKEIEEAKKAADLLETRVAKARDTGSNGERDRAEAGLTNLQTPPEYIKSYNQNSQPFSFSKFCRFLIHDTYDEGLAPFETATLNMYKKCLKESGCALETQTGTMGFWLPTTFETYGGRLTQSDKYAKDFHYVKSVFENTRPAYDPDEAEWRRRRFYKDVQTASQSAYADPLGGSLVAPPIQGDVIPLIRPQAAFLAAGAQAMTLPPNGRYVAPRITGAPQVFATGESQTTNVTQLTTDQMELTAKKITGAVVLTEEGTMFTSGTLDNICQMELGRSLGLKLDFYGFYGPGGSQMPSGITNNIYAGTGIGNVLNIETNPATSACKGIGGNGNQLLPQYGDYFPALIAERSFNMDAATGAWVMRPSTFSTAVGLRADAVAAGDQAGVLVDLLRRFDNAGPTSWRGRKVVQTTNISNTDVKGTNSALTDVFFSIWQYNIFASYGAIQFMQGHVNNQFLNGQITLRATMFGDVGLMYPGANLYYPNCFGFSGNGQF